MILAVDTGLKNFGYAVFKNWTGSVYHVGLVRAKPDKKISKHRTSDDYSRRVCLIAKHLDDVIRRWKITELVGEMPPFGAQSSKAAIGLTAGASIILTLCETHNIKATWVTPRELKEGFTGDTHADKKQIMKEVCRLYGWDITGKQVKDKGKSSGYRTDYTYHVLKEKYGSGAFEHIADAIAAYYAGIRIGRCGGVY